uniref:Uncharacterized protein n=1 Tax=Strigamia maritima TaxID=126957 RepID=T1IX32_STRMM
MLRFVWLFSCFCFFQARSTHSACVVYGKEYNAEEYAYLCKDNVTVPEKIVQEILELNPSAALDSHYFSQLAQETLGTLMTTFREDVADIYIKTTCDNHFCHPHLLKAQKPNVPENIPRFMEIDSIELIGIQSLPGEIYDLAIMPGLNDEIYLTVTFFSGEFVTLLQYNQNKFDYLRDFKHSGNCLATTSSLWTPPMMIVTTCRQMETFEFEYHQTAITPIYIFTATNTGMELTQALEVNSQVTAAKVYFNRGIPALLTLTDDGIGHQHIWNDYEFDLLSSIPLSTATHVASFKIGLGTYFVLSNFLPVEGIGLAGAHVYQSLRQKPDQFQLFQRLGSCLASSTEHFTISDLHFVAITCRNEDLAYIYWWAENQFLLWQTIPTVKAKSWTAVRLINWEILLVLVEYPDGIPVIRFFQYEDDYFRPIDNDIVLHRHARNRQIKIASFHYETDTILVINGQDPKHPVGPTFKLKIPHFELEHDYELLNTLSIFKIILKLRATKPTDNQDEIIKCLIQVERTLDEEHHRLAMLDVPTWDVMVTDKKQTVSGEKILLEGLDAHEVHVENLILHPTVTVEPDDDYICHECEAKVREVNNKLNRLYKEAEDLVLTTRPAEVVTGKKILRNIAVQEMLLSVDMFSGPVCNIDLKELNATSLRRTGDQLLNITTMHTHFTTTNIDIIKLVNKVDLHNVATLHGSRHFNARQIFSQVKVDAVEIRGKLNDINITEIVVNDLSQTIYGEKKIIGNLIVEGEIKIKNKLNQINFTDWARNVLTTDTDQIITENVVFEHLNVKLIKAKNLRGIDLYEFSSKVLNTNTPQLINGLITFESDIVLNSMTAKRINNINFPSDLLTTNTTQHIRNPLQINGKVTIHDSLTVDWTVNDLDWPDDIVANYGIQTIAGHKVFKQEKLSVNGEISMARGSRVNAVDLSELGYPTAISHRNLIVEDLHVGTINGESIYDLLAVLKTTGRQTISSNFTFTDVELNTIQVRGLIVDHRIEYDFITLNTSQTIDEEVVFDQKVNIFNMELKDGVQINGRDLSKIYVSAVHIDGNHVIRGHKTFLKDVTAKNVILKPEVKLTNVDISEELFLTNKYQVVIALLEINEVKINNNLIIHGNFETEWVDKIKINDFFNKVVYKQGEFLIHGIKHFRKNVVVHHQLNVHLINDFDIDQLQTKIVRLSTVQNISGHLIFHAKLHLNAHSHVTKVNNKILGFEASLLANTRNDKVHTAVTFQNRVTFKQNIEVVTLNNITLKQFFMNVLSKSQPQNLSYTRDIIHNVKIDYLTVSKLNEILLKDVIRVNNTNTISAPIVFHQKLDITSDVVLGTINNITLEELQKQTIIKSENMVIRGKKTFKRVEVREVTVDKFINNVNINELPTRLVLTHKNQTITGDVTFQKGLTVSLLDSNVPINGVDIVHLKTIAVMKNTKQTIIGRKKFIFPVRYNIDIHNNVDVTGSITHVKLVHGLNLTKVEDEALIDGKKQIIIAPIIFKNNVIFNEEVLVIGTTNSLKFPHDFVMVNDSQIIHGAVTFSSIEIRKIHITSFVNRVNLTHLINSRLTLSSTQTIQRPLVFNEHVTITSDLIVNNKLNHLTCGEIVSIDGKQDIVGPKMFSNVITTNIATDFINDIHWLVLNNRIDQTIRKKWVHHETVSFTDNVILKGQWESDVKAREATYALIHDATLNIKQNIKKASDFRHWLNTFNQCMYDAVPQIQNLARYLDNFEKAISLPPAVDIAIVPFARELHLLLVNPSNYPQECFNVIMFTCPNETNPASCYPTSRSDWFQASKIALDSSIEMTQKIDVVYGKNISFLLVHNSDSTGNCSNQLGGVHLFGLTKDLIRIEWFKAIDAISILPGYPYSLLATASTTTGQITVSRINCTSGTCVLKSRHNTQYDGKPLKLEWFYYNNTTRLVVITALNLTTGENRVPSFIYEWNERELVRTHVFLAVAPIDAVTFTINDISYLAIGSYDCINSMDSDRIRIHQISSNEVKIVQEIRLSTKVLSVLKVDYLSETYLAVAHPENDVFVYRWHGFFGFQLWNKVMINKPQRINWYISRSAGMLYMTIAGNDRNSHSFLVTTKTVGPRPVKIQIN